VKRIGVVVPTLFSRGDYLRHSLEAIQKAGDAYVILMGPNVETNSKDYKGLFDQRIEEPKTGTLSEKLSLALSSFPDNIDLITWIGDDDLLAPGSLEFLEKQFKDDENLYLTYGACDYIDSNGNKIGQNISGPWAIALAKIGPFLAPQPGSLFSRHVFEAIGGLDSNLKLAFDFDLFMGLHKHGKAKYINKTLASFRWHEGSLSVGQRKTSVKEASIVRIKHASLWLRPLLIISNPLVEVATYLAGSFVNWRLKAKTSR
jgi:hypothetical protein